MAGVTDAIDIYVHGLPGSPEEAKVAFPAGHEPVATLAPWQVENVLEQRAADDALPARMMAFSLGAHAAIQAAARHPHAVRELFLVSPAAPLQLGNFLPAMAGAPVFRTAQLGRAPLAALTIAQSLALRLAPNRLIDNMFVRTAPAERALLKEPAFRRAIATGLRSSLVAGRANYLDAVLHYVADWTPVLSRIQCPVTIVHGDADAWAPPAMTEALATHLSADTMVRMLPGEGHYGALRHVTRP